MLAGTCPSDLLQPPAVFAVRWDSVVQWSMARKTLGHVTGIKQGGAAPKSFLSPPAPCGPSSDGKVRAQAVPRRGHGLGWKHHARHLSMECHASSPMEKKRSS